MEDFRSLSTDQLLEMLSHHTADYVRMIREGGDTSASEYVISMIQSEINGRKSSMSDKDISSSEHASL